MIKQVSYSPMIHTIIYSLSYSIEDEEIGFWNKVNEISEVYGKDNIQFRALVLLNTSENSIVDIKREKYFLWALDNSFELIDINMSKLLDTFNDREKDGLPRLIEAIQSTNWSSIEKNTNDTRTSATANVSLLTYVLTDFISLSITYILITASASNKFSCEH